MQPTNRISFPGRVHLIRNDQELLDINLASLTALGFDTETRPSFKKGDVFQVALLQLASETDAYLIRLHFLTQFQRIIYILENKNIVKVGLAIGHDLKILQKTFKFEPHGFVDLQVLAKKHQLQNLGLKGMCEEVLQGSMSKRSKLTNWEASTLTNDQRMYAATDAWACLAIYRKLLTGD
jgi:ribonuclease D